MSQPPPLARRAQDILAGLAASDRRQLARRTGATLTAGGLRLPVWGTFVQLSWPDLLCQPELDPVTHALLAYYLAGADGTPPTNRWVAFSELPDGAFYAAAFQGYTGQVLARRFGDDLVALERAAVAQGGQRDPLADLAFRFWALPLVPVLVAAWQGDEEFPSSYRILFDAGFGHHLPTDAAAIIGSALTRRLCREAAGDSAQNEAGLEE